MDTINLQPHLALCIPELRKIILSFCSDNASAYYVCIDWFHALDEVLAAGDKKPYAYARQAAAALRLGFKLRNWQGYRFLMRAKGHRLITSSGPWRSITNFEDDPMLDDLIGSPGGVNRKFAWSDLSAVNNCLFEFHNLAHECPILSKKAKVAAISLDLTEEVVALEYAFENPKVFAALDAEAVCNGIGGEAPWGLQAHISAWEPPLEALQGGIAIELPQYVGAARMAGLFDVGASSLEQALDVAESQGRVGEMAWVAGVIAELEAEGRETYRQAFVAAGAVVEPGAEARETKWLTVTGAIAEFEAETGETNWQTSTQTTTRPPETIKDGLYGDEMNENWDWGWGEGVDEGAQLPKDAQSLVNGWFQAHGQVAQMCPKHIAVEDSSEAATVGDLKELLKNMCVSEFFDADEEPDFVWLTSNRVKVERTFRPEPKLVKFVYVQRKQDRTRITDGKDLRCTC